MKISSLIVAVLLIAVVTSFPKSRLKFHTTVVATDEDEKVMKDFLSFIFNDEDIMTTFMTGAQPDEAVTKKILEWMCNNDAYLDMIARQMKNDPQNAWVTELSPEAQRQFVKITLQQMSRDSSHNFFDTSDYQPSESVMASMVRRYLENPEIAAGFWKSIGFEKEFDSEQNQKFLRNLNQEWKDWDFSNLTDEQKSQLMEYFIAHPQLGKQGEGDE